MKLGIDGLAEQVMSLKEGIDDPGRDIPPAVESNPIIQGTLMFSTVHRQLKPHEWSKFRTTER